MKRTIVYLALIIALGIAISASAETISWARVFTPGGEGYDRLRTDDDLDVITEIRSDYTDIIAEESNIDKLRAEGFTVEYLMYDIYDPAHYEGKGYSGYSNYSELMTRLNALATNYPSICTLTDLGLGRQGTHHVWMLKISDDVANDDASEPDAMLTGVHHAREPMSLEIPIYFAEQLCAEYGTDPDITELVNNLEFYIIPLVNPEGYNYDDIESDRNYWRKNGYDWPNPNYPTDWGGGEGTGIDPNRQYTYMWGYDNYGSSPNWWSQAYRGEAPATEPENQYIIALCEAKDFVAALHYHQYGYILYRPFGYNGSAPPSNDLAIFNEIANGYRDVIDDVSGIWFDYEPGGTNGNAYDYMYGEHGAFSFVVETCDSFYPDDSEIGPACNRHYEALKWWSQYLIDNFGSSDADDEGENPATPAAFELLSVYPNPASEKASFSFALPESAEVKVGLFDIRGRKVNEIAKGLPEGENTLSMDISSLSDGLYFYNVEAGEERAAGKLVVR